MPASLMNKARRKASPNKLPEEYQRPCARCSQSYARMWRGVCGLIISRTKIFVEQTSQSRNLRFLRTTKPFLVFFCLPFSSYRQFFWGHKQKGQPLRVCHCLLPPKGSVGYSLCGAHASFLGYIEGDSLYLFCEASLICRPVR